MHTVTTPLEHRPSTPAACTPQTTIAAVCTVSTSDACHTASDCTAGLDGNCISNSFSKTPCACVYDDCLTDSDCPVGTACSCDANRSGPGASANPTKCVPASCRLDSDCGPGGFCSPSTLAAGPGQCGSGMTGFYCHTAADECGNASDCPATLGNACLYAPEVGHWICSSQPGPGCTG
jgi:hypothetical protein